MIFIMNERQYAKRVLNGNGYGEKQLYTSIVIAKYYKSLGYEKREIKAALEKLVRERNPYAPDESVDFWVKKSIESAEKYPLYETDGIVITKPEIEKIRQIHSQRFKDYRIQRLAFTLLCLAKFGSARGIKNYWVNASLKDIFKIANIKGQTIKKQCLFINELFKAGYIDLNPKIENESIRVLGAADGESEVVVGDINEAGMVYEEYCGKRFVKCRVCGKMIAVTNGRNLYCKQCAEDINRVKTRERMRKTLNF